MDSARVPQQDVPVDVHDGEVEKHVDCLGATNLLNDGPTQIQTVGIEDAKSAAVILETDVRQNGFRQDRVAVAVKDGHIAALARNALKLANLDMVKVDEVVVSKWGSDVERDLRATRYERTGASGHVAPGAGKRIDVYVEETRVVLSGKNRRVCLGILLDYLKFDLAPRPNLIENIGLLILFGYLHYRLLGLAWHLRQVAPAYA